MSKTKPLIMSSLFVSLYFVLSMITFLRLPFGGSATPCASLFLVLPGFIYGKKYGLVSCIVASFISFALSPYFLSPVQFLFDYTFVKLSWSIGCFLFKNNTKFAIEKYYLVGMLFAYLSAIIAGIAFWGEYTPEGWNVVAWSVVYNGSYYFAEGLLVLIVLRLKIIRNSINKEVVLNS